MKDIVQIWENKQKTKRIYLPKIYLIIEIEFMKKS
jgi:hypothetical protein